MEKLINQTLRTGLVVIFCSLFSEELFLHLSNEEIDEIDKIMENVERYRGKERV